MLPSQLDFLPVSAGIFHGLSLRLLLFKVRWQIDTCQPPQRDAHDDKDENLHNRIHLSTLCFDFLEKLLLSHDLARIPVLAKHHDVLTSKRICVRIKIATDCGACLKKNKTGLSQNGL